MNCAEEWRVIETAPDYEISSIGRCRRCRPDWQGKYLGKILRPGFSRGYARYTLCIEGRHVTRSAHTLVCEAFNGAKPDPSLHCAHRDDDKNNNIPANLYWATPKQNIADRDRNGRTHRGPRSAESIARLPRGEKHYTRTNPEKIKRGKDFWRTGTHGIGAFGERMGCAKLTEQQVREILAEPKVHGSGRRLADKYGVSMGLITAIRKRRAWAYLDR